MHAYADEQTRQGIMPAVQNVVLLKESSKRKQQ